MTEGPAENSLDALYRRPGFLLRRAHQISVALFLEEAAGLGLTTTRYGAMLVLRARGSLDQVGVATLVGIDRSTTALVVSKLAEAGHIERRDDAVDKRRKIITLSPAGHAMLDRVAEPAQRARERALEPFTARDAAKSSVCWNASSTRSTSRRVRRSGRKPAEAGEAQGSIMIRPTAIAPPGRPMAPHA